MPETIAIFIHPKAIREFNIARFRGVYWWDLTGKRGGINWVEEKGIFERDKSASRPKANLQEKRGAKGSERNYCTLMLDEEGEQRRKIDRKPEKESDYLLSKEQDSACKIHLSTMALIIQDIPEFSVIIKVIGRDIPWVPCIYAMRRFPCHIMLEFGFYN